MSLIHILTICFIFIFTASAQSTSHDAIAACLLVPTISNTKGANTDNPPHPQRIRLSSNRLGRIHFFYDTKDQVATEARGHLPATLSASPQQPRGFHVHDFGDLRTNTSQGEHFTGAGEGASPFHATPGYLPRHRGDMGNLISETVQMKDEMGWNSTFLWTLKDAPETGVLGRSVVIHAKKDQGVDSQPSGASGDRLFHCVLGIANSTQIRRIAGDTTSDLSLNKARASTAVTDYAVAELYSATPSLHWNKLYGRALIIRTPHDEIKVEVRVCGLQQLKRDNGTGAGFRVDIHQFGDLTGETIAANAGPILTRVYREVPNPEGSPTNVTSVRIEEGAVGEGEVFHEVIGGVGDLKLLQKNRAVLSETLDALDLEEHAIGRSIVVKREAKNEEHGSDNVVDRVLIGVIGIANTGDDVEKFKSEVWKGMPCFEE